MTDPVVRRYEDGLGVFHEIAPQTEEVVRQAIGEAQPHAAVVAEEGRSTEVGGGHWELTLEDGTTLEGDRTLPADLPIGYHEIRTDSDAPRLLLVRPVRCPLSVDQPMWGVAAQAYAARSSRSWGMGDLGDLATLGRWVTNDLGAGFVLINPLYAASPGLPQEPSPYSATSRTFLGPLYIAIEGVDGFSALPDAETLVASGRRLNEGRTIDRDAIYRLKIDALERLWASGRNDGQVEAFRLSASPTLRTFATYCALAEVHGRRWNTWPAELRHPGSAAVARFASENADRIHFHEWIQWLLDRQLAVASAAAPLMVDLPIGFDPDGADAWAHQDSLALGVRVGAPPDEFNPRGQDWGLPPFAPHNLARARYRPLAESLRHTLRHAWALRIDHVMGLFRQFWVPLGMPPAEGAYVLFPHEELLAVLAIESHRAGTLVVGEDLGTVEPHVRHRLGELGLLSYKLLWFEPGPPQDYARLSMAAVTTHDLPTVAGVWTREEQRMLEEAGLPVRTESLAAMRERLRGIVGHDDAQVEDVIVEAHRRLGAASSLLVAATLDDLLAVPEPPNRPGTIREWPNWSLALPVSLEHMFAHPLPPRVAAAMREGREASGRR